MQGSWIRGFAASFLTLGLLAHPPVPANAQSDDPGVAFVSTLNGGVSVQRGDSGSVEAAGINAPLMVGDYVSTAPDGRAEVQFDYGHVVRVGPNSQIRFAELGANDDTVQLAQGTVGVGVLHATSQFTQVETPSATIRPREAGFYRVTINSDGTTAITVRRGNAAVLLPQGTRWLDPGSTMLVWGPADHPSFRYVGTYGSDPFDQWNDQRNGAFEQANAYTYAAPGIPGLYGLTGYGQWQNAPDYGNEWIPNVPSDWSPYSSGQWVSEPYYGWTWVDNQPWGYAPFHYGRWYRDQRRNRWAWVPGPRAQTRPQWSPALVAFIGFGGGAGVSIALFNNIGWVPLGPSEQPHPWWGSASRAYAPANVTDIRTVYQNSRYPNAVHGISRQSFASGQFQHIAPVSTANFARAAVIRSALPIVPSAQTQRFTQRAPAAGHAPSAQAFHTFKTQPRAPQTFAQQRTFAAAAQQRVRVAPAAAPPHPAAQAHAAPPERARPVAQPQRPQAAAQPERARPVTPQRPPQGAAAPQERARPAVPQQRPQAAAPPQERARPAVPQQRPQAAAPPQERARPVAPQQRPQPVLPQQRPQAVAPVPRQAAAPPRPPAVARPAAPPPAAAARPAAAPAAAKRPPPVDPEKKGEAEHQRPAQ